MNVIVIHLTAKTVLMMYVLNVIANETVSHNNFCIGFSLCCI